MLMHTEPAAGQNCHSRRFKRAGVEQLCGMKLLIVAASILLCGCDPATRGLAHGYRLEISQESGDYYVTSPDDLYGIGIFEGTVQQIGWNENWILARVMKCSHGDTNGWYALDLRTRQVLGPIPETELGTNVWWSQIKCCAPGEVFKK